MSDVKDPLMGNDVSFADAVRRGIIDRDTGDYVDRHSGGERLSITEAIQLGLVSARLLDDDDELFTFGVHRRHSLVVDKIDRLRTNVFSKIRAVNAFKSAAGTK